MYLIINSQIAQLLVQLLQVLGPLKLVHLALHVVVLSNLVKVLLILFTVVDSHSDTLAPETTSAANPVDIGLRVSFPHAVGEMEGGHIKVDDNFDLRHINTPGKHICCDDHVDLTLAEFVHDQVSFLPAHLTEHDCGLVVILAQSVLHEFTELLCVDEDDCLGQGASVENIHDEFDLLFGLTFELVLLNVVQVQFLFLLSD